MQDSAVLHLQVNLQTSYLYFRRHMGQKLAAQFYPTTPQKAQECTRDSRHYLLD